MNDEVMEDKRLGYAMDAASDERLERENYERLNWLETASPCPFCDSRTMLGNVCTKRGRIELVCDNCEGEAPVRLMGIGRDWEDAVDNWNTIVGDYLATQVPR